MRSRFFPLGLLAVLLPSLALAEMRGLVRNREQPASPVILRLPLTVSTADECSGASIPGVTFSRSSSATCTKSDGTVVTLAANQPRVTAAGLLVEGGATNLLLQSEAFDNAAWTKSTATVTADAAIAPDGNQTADRIQNASASGNVRNAVGITVTSGASYVFSFYAKNNGGTVAAYSVFCASSSTDLVSSTSYFSSLSSTSWTRIAVPFTATSCTSVYVYPHRDGGAGTDLYVWGAQLETGSIATSYIPTAGTSAARTADLASVAQPAGLTDTAGCVGVTFNVSSSVATNTRVIAFGGINRLAASGSMGLVANDGTNGAAVTISSFVGRSVRAIARWSGSTLTLEADGSTGTASYDGSILSDPIYLGSTSSGSASLNGTIANVQFGRTFGACQ